VRVRFATAPAWFRPVLTAEDLVLRRLRGRLPTTARLHTDDGPIAGNVVNERLDVVAAERMVPGGNASPYMVEHVARYTWAMARCGGRTVVDLGCGDGYGTFMLSWTAARAVGIDVSAAAVEHARERYRGVEYRAGDLADPATIPHADVGICFEVLEHVRDADRLLETALRRVNRLLVSFPNPLVAGSHINPHHVNDWPLSTLKRRLRDAGAHRLRTYHQHFRRPDVRRHAVAWHGTWLLDATR